MRLFNRQSQPITDWRAWTRPKEDKQWRATRSAMELARAWFTSPVPVIPSEIAALLATQAATAGATIEEGWPELKTPLPERGEGRNHDLVLVGNAPGGRLLVAIEAKVDETLGPEIGTYWRKSKETKGSFAWRRTDALLGFVFGNGSSAISPPWSELAYQLLTAIAGTAIEAAHRDSNIAVLVIHEFVTESSKPELVKKNAGEYRAFLSSLGVPKAESGVLHGPFPISTPTRNRTMPVYIGKAEYRWESVI